MTTRSFVVASKSVYGPLPPPRPRLPPLPPLPPPRPPPLPPLFMPRNVGLFPFASSARKYANTFSLYFSSIIRLRSFSIASVCFVLMCFRTNSSAMKSLEDSVDPYRFSSKTTTCALIHSSILFSKSVSSTNRKTTGSLKHVKRSDHVESTRFDHFVAISFASIDSIGASTGTACSPLPNANVDNGLRNEHFALKFLPSAISM